MAHYRATQAFTHNDPAVRREFERVGEGFRTQEKVNNQVQTQLNDIEGKIPKPATIVKYGCEMSIVSTIKGDVVTFKFKNDEENPASNYYYGTDSTGKKGYHPLPEVPIIRIQSVDENRIHTDLPAAFAELSTELTQDSFYYFEAHIYIDAYVATAPQALKYKFWFHTTDMTITGTSWHSRLQNETQATSETAPPAFNRKEFVYSDAHITFLQNVDLEGIANARIGIVGDRAVETGYANGVLRIFGYIHTGTNTEETPNQLVDFYCHPMGTVDLTIKQHSFIKYEKVKTSFA